MEGAEKANDELKQTEQRVEQELRDFRSRAATADDVFRVIEGNFVNSFDNLKDFKLNEAEKAAFCNKYIIKIVLDLAKDRVDKDLILATFGLLMGYEDTEYSVSKRRDIYCDTVGKRDKKDGQFKPYSICWKKILPNGEINKNFYRNITMKEERAIRKLAKAVSDKMGKNNGVLGYIKDVDKIAEIVKMAYPEPFYLREEVYRKCTYEGKVFYVPLSEQELVRKAQHMILELEEADTAEDKKEEEQTPIDNGDGADAGEDADSLINPPEPPPPPPVVPPDPPDPPPLPKQNRFQIFLEHAKKILLKYKVAIIVSCVIIAFIAGGIVTYLTSPLWSGDGSNKDSDYDGPGWGDNGGMRPSYTADEVKAGALGNKIIFNTISDSMMGNEKNFVGAREYTGINAGVNNVWEGNDIVVEDGKEYIIRLYVHNNNRDGYGGIAEDTRVSFSIPGESSTHITVNGFITSSNATPSKYWDYVTFHAPTAFHLEYQSGSALLENNGIGEGGLLLSDAVVYDANGGSPIGFESLDGCIPGGYPYDSYISIRVKAIFDVAYTLETQVRLVGGDKTWGNSVDAKVGDKVEFRIAYKNNDAVDHLHVGIKDILPTGLKYIEGSTTIVNAKYPNGGTVQDDNLVKQGINIGSHIPGSNAFVCFQAEVVDEELEPHGNTGLVNWAQCGVGQATIQDYATVRVIKD